MCKVAHALYEGRGEQQQSSTHQPWLEVQASNKFVTSATLPRGKKPPLPIASEAGGWGTRACTDVLEKTKIYYASREFNTNLEHRA